MSDARFRRSQSPIFSLKPIKNKKDATKIVRSEEQELLQNGFFDKDDNGKMRRECKIHRIPMISTALVTVSVVYSPSFIFVKPINHITDQLILREPCQLVSLDRDELREWNYCLVPVEDRAYGRARIIEIISDPEAPTTHHLVNLILIDEGKTVWAKASALCSMDPKRSKGAKDLAYHPWQVIGVTLAGVAPARTISNPDRKWTKTIRARLVRLIKEHEEFKITAITLSESNNDYGITAPVALYGLRDKELDDEKRVKKENEEDTRDREITRRGAPPAPEELDIGGALAGLSPGEIIETRIYDGRKQERFLMMLTREEEKAAREPFVDDIRKQPIPEWTLEEKDASASADDWIKPMEDVQIQDTTEEWLRENKYFYNTNLFVSLEGTYTVSPWEFYARPIKLFVEKEESTGDGGDGDGEGKKSSRHMMGEADAMLQADTILKSYSAQLDLFYSKDSNRKQMDKYEMTDRIAEGSRVFAICQAEPNRAEYTGQWQRVEVLHTDQFATVRFLDSGGTAIVMYGQIFHMHPDHSLWRPLCVQLCLHGVQLAASPAGETWAAGDMTKEKHFSIERFRNLMREDLPISLDLCPSFVVPPNLPAGPAYSRRGVLFVSDLKCHGMSNNIINDMCTTPAVARKNPNVPFTRQTPK